MTMKMKNDLHMTRRRQKIEEDYSHQQHPQPLQCEYLQRACCGGDLVCAVHGRLSGVVDLRQQPHHLQLFQRVCVCACTCARESECADLQTSKPCLCLSESDTIPQKPPFCCQPTK